MRKLLLTSDEPLGLARSVYPIKGRLADFAIKPEFIFFLDIYGSEHVFESGDVLFLRDGSVKLSEHGIYEPFDASVYGDDTRELYLRWLAGVRRWRMPEVHLVKRLADSSEISEKKPLFRTGLDDVSFRVGNVVFYELENLEFVEDGIFLSTDDHTWERKMYIKAIRFEPVRRWGRDPAFVKKAKRFRF